MADIYDILPTLRPGIPLCAGDRIAPGTAHDIALHLQGSDDPVSLIVLRLETGEPRAFLNRCAHFGLPLNIRPDYGFVESVDGEMALRCQHHYMDFSADTGEGLSFECRGDSLVVLSVTEKDGHIVTA